MGQVLHTGVKRRMGRALQPGMERLDGAGLSHNACGCIFLLHRYFMLLFGRLDPRYLIQLLYYHKFIIMYIQHDNIETCSLYVFTA